MGSINPSNLRILFGVLVDYSMCLEKIYTTNKEHVCSYIARFLRKTWLYPRAKKAILKINVGFF